MSRREPTREEPPMQRIGEGAARAFKTLAGQDTDAPLSAQVFAIYGFLFLVALVLFSAWITGVPQ